MQNLNMKLRNNDYVIRTWNTENDLIYKTPDHNPINATIIDGSVSSENAFFGKQSIECNLYFSDTLTYWWENRVRIKNKQRLDSLQASYRGDTLVFKYIITDEPKYQNTGYYEQEYFSLQIPQNIPVTLINATLRINKNESPSPDDTLSVNLSDQAGLIIEPDYYVSRSTGKDTFRYLNLPNLKINCESSSVTIRGKIQIPSLSIATRNASLVSIDNDVSIKSFKGQFSDSTWLGLSNQYRKQMK